MSHTVPYPFLSLRVVRKLVPHARRAGLAEALWGPDGFVGGYERCGGFPERIHAAFRRGRRELIAYHERNELPLWDETGAPTPRHLELAMVAYSPDAARLERWALAAVPARVRTWREEAASPARASAAALKRARGKTAEPNGEILLIGALNPGERTKRAAVPGELRDAMGFPKGTKLVPLAFAMSLPRHDREGKDALPAAFGGGSSRAIEKLIESIGTKGFTQALTIEKRRKGGFWVSEGNHRLAAARRLGIELIPMRLMWPDGTPAPWPENLAELRKKPKDMAFFAPKPRAKVAEPNCGGACGCGGTCGKAPKTAEPNRDVDSDARHAYETAREEWSAARQAWTSSPSDKAAEDRYWRAAERVEQTLADVRYEAIPHIRSLASKTAEPNRAAKRGGKRREYRVAVADLPQTPSLKRALAAAKRNHGYTPTHATVFEIDDGRPEVTEKVEIEIGVNEIEIDTVKGTDGRLQRIRPIRIGPVYGVPKGKRSVKAGRQFIHSAIDDGGKPALLVYEPDTGIFSYAGGTSRLQGKWIVK